MLFSHVDTSWLRRIRESVRFGSLTDMAISPRRAARASSAVANDGHPLFEHFVGAGAYRLFERSGLPPNIEG